MLIWLRKLLNTAINTRLGSRRWNRKFRKSIFEIRIPNFCYIQVITKYIFYIFHNFFMVADFKNSYPGIFDFTVGILITIICPWNLLLERVITIAGNSEAKGKTVACLLERSDETLKEFADDLVSFFFTSKSLQIKIWNSAEDCTLTTVFRMITILTSSVMS